MRVRVTEFRHFPAIQEYVESRGYSLVRIMWGIYREDLHEAPKFPTLSYPAAATQAG